MSSDFNRSKSLVKRTKSFFGVESDYSCDEIDAWNQRRLKFCVNKFGNVNYDKLKPADISQSINVTDNESNVANVDFLDGSFPTSSVSHYPGSNLNTTFLSRSTKGFLNGSIISPQTSVQAYGDPMKKPHAFRALASVVSESLKSQKSRRDECGRPPGYLKSHSEEHEEPLEPMEMEFQSLKPESVRLKSRASVKLRPSLKWSESMIQTVRAGRRRFADSWVGRVVCCMSQRQSKPPIDELPQFRPYFTYWVSLVQIVVFVAAVSVYGLAPVRLEPVHKTLAELVVPSAAIEQVCRFDRVNMFVGPSQAALIRLGARYSPCMRRDRNLQLAVVEEQRARDRRSGCCIRNDGGGCYQTVESRCGPTLATWVATKPVTGRHNDYENTGNTRQPVVCGLDPEFCEHPRSMAPFNWPDDVIRWPVCLQPSSVGNATPSARDRHVRCELTGRPCCIGSTAECIITTLQHCTFLRGHYHPQAALCSQVNCLNEICGMLAFLDPDRPDQFYRFLTAIFLNSSLGGLVVTLCVQLTIMRDLEKMAGWHRISLIYLLSGVLGNLCSGVFLPYQVQTGASGSLFALLAMTFTEFLQSWRIVDRPWPVLIRFAGLGLFLFALGFLPFFDNYAHMSGMLSGVLLSFVLLPFLGLPSSAALQKLLARSTSVTPDAADKQRSRMQRRRLLIVVGCAALWLLLAAVGLVLFYWRPVTQCAYCKYFNCLPLLPHFCDNMDVNITTSTACVVKD